VITGNDGANVLDGAAGNDTLVGGGGETTGLKAVTAMTCWTAGATATTS